MNYKVENGELIVFPTGSIDTTNAEAVGKEIDEIKSANPNEKLVLDMDELKYISSAGLRQILRLKKQNKELKLTNVNSEVYEIFDMTGFTEMMDITKAYRKFSVDGCEVIGEGSNGVVYRINPDTIIKVYRNSDALDDIKKERELARTALVLGINTAIPYDVVKVGDKFGSVFELLSAKSITKLILQYRDDEEKIDEYVKIFAKFLVEIHGTLVKPNVLPDAKDKAVDWCKYLENYLPKETYDKLLSMLEAIPSSLNIVHGDYHTNNVHYSDEPILIDMDTLSCGNPVFDLANFYLAYRGYGALDHTITEKFLKIPCELVDKIYDKFFPYYFEGKDEAFIEDQIRKAKIVGLTRMYRRTLRRDKDNTALLDYCKNSLIEEVNKIDSLEI